MFLYNRLISIPTDIPVPIESVLVDMDRYISHRIVPSPSVHILTVFRVASCWRLSENN
jgi:hypothetical protein